MTSTTARKPGVIRVNLGTVIATAVVLVALFAAATALAMSGWKTPEIVGLLTAVVGIAAPVVVLLDRVVSVERDNKEQLETLATHGEQLTTITAQTNGVLTKRIQDAVSSALAASLNGPTVQLPVKSESDSNG